MVFAKRPDSLTGNEVPAGGSCTITVTFTRNNAAFWFGALRSPQMRAPTYVLDSLARFGNLFAPPKRDVPKRRRV
jgi:hypothetical protein